MSCGYTWEMWIGTATTHKMAPCPDFGSEHECILGEDHEGEHECSCGESQEEE